MKYTSTRDTSISALSAEAIKQGLSKEGGLFVPCEIPKINVEDFERLSKLDYCGRAMEILGKFLDDFSESELRECVEGAYASGRFESEDIAPIRMLGDKACVLELWHGPTCAFKDMALQILPRLLTRAMKKTGEKSTAVILVATSGDTGKAALEGFCDVEGTKIIVFYPDSGVSGIQRLQMVTQRGDNVAVGAVSGNFDDAQNGVKAIFTDKEYEKELLDSGYILSSANSINWGRLVPQIVYYISAYCDLFRSGKIELGDGVNICVPTGNFGNILAAYYAKKMGLPVKKLICASNANNILTDFIKTGVYDLNRDFYTTISPSMDILVSSNLERLLFDLSGQDASATTDLMDALKKDGRYRVDEKTKKAMDSLLEAGFCDDAATMAAIAEIKEKYDYVCDTHTAVALKVYFDYAKRSGDDTLTIIASTASPFKFNESVLRAIEGEEAVAGKSEFELLLECERVCGFEAPRSLRELEHLPERFSQKCEKDGLKNFVSGVLGL